MKAPRVNLAPQPRTRMAITYTAGDARPEDKERTFEPLDLDTELAPGEAEEIARLIEEKAGRDEPERVTPALYDAVMTARENGFTVSKGERVLGQLAKAPKSAGFGQPRRLDYLLGYDTENDPNSVIGDRWLCRGRSFIFVSQSGVGKSSMTTQLALGWALERPDLTFGIKPVRPLRQMIVQAENDDGDLAEPAKGIASGYELSKTDVRAASELVEWLEVVGLSGDAFLDTLEADLEARALRGEAIDLCWIDPLNNFIGGDISRIEFVKEFAERLDVIGRRLGTCFAIIHHTGKPSKDERETTPSDLAYSMLGSSGLTNWAREVVVLKREHVAEGEPPTFSFTATKRRKKAGMATIAPEGEGGTGAPTESIFVRHASDGSIRWEQCPAPDAEGQSKKSSRRQPKSIRGPGRPSSLSHEQKLLIADAVSANGGNPLISSEELKKLTRKLGKTERSVRGYLQDAAKKSLDARAALVAEGVIADE